MPTDLTANEAVEMLMRPEGMVPPAYAKQIKADLNNLPVISPREAIKRYAVLSDDGEYRYTLERRCVTADCNPLVLMAIGVNPSDADAERDDPTVVRLYGFCRTLGYGHLLVGNKFARRSPNVAVLRKAGDPIGPQNDHYLEHLMQRATIVVAAWGPLTKLPGALQGRWKDVVRIADSCGQPLWCLGTAHDGHPRHPLMLPADTKLEPWKVPWFAGRTPAPWMARDALADRDYVPPQGVHNRITQAEAADAWACKMNALSVDAGARAVSALLPGGEQ